MLDRLHREPSAGHHRMPGEFAADHEHAGVRVLGRGEGDGGARVMTVMPVPAGSNRARARVVVPASSTIVDPGRILAAARRATRSLLSVARSCRSRTGRSAAGIGRAPPYTRWSFPSSASSRRSRRIASSETPTSSATVLAPPVHHGREGRAGGLCAGRRACVSSRSCTIVHDSDYSHPHDDATADPDRRPLPLWHRPATPPSSRGTSPAWRRPRARSSASATCR